MTASKKRFSLRSLILAMTAICLLLGTWSVYVDPYRQQANSLALVYRLKGDAQLVPTPGPGVQRWLVETMLGDDTFVDVTGVDLSGCAVDDSALGDLRGLRWLARLNLDRTQITDAGASALVSFPQLTELSLRFTRIGDSSATYLANLVRLKTLYLTSTDVTDAAIADLQKLSAPIDLYIRWTKITAAGAERLRQSLPPDSHVYHNSLMTDVATQQ